MLNFGWAELMVIGVVALIVIGPEDLPDMFRQMGRFTAKLRAMSREFSRAMDQAAKDAGVKDVAKDLKNITSPKAMGLDAVKSAADKFEKWDPMKNAAKPTSSMMPAKPLVPPPMPATPVAATPVVPGDVLVPSDVLVPGDVLVTDDMAEADDDLADHAAPAHGPATQALFDKQAAKAAVMAEQTAKLKAIDDGTYQAENTILPPAAPRKRPPRAKTQSDQPTPVVKAAPEAKVAVTVAAKPPRKSSKKAAAS